MSVKQLPNGKWYYRFEFGKRGHLKGGFQIRKQAEQAEIVKKAELQRMKAYGFGYSDGIKLSELVDMFYKEYVLPYKRSWKGDRAQVRVIKKYFGDKKVRDIMPRDIEAFLRAVPELVRGKKQRRATLSTVNRYHASIKSIINWGKKKRVYMGDNPAWGIPMQKTEKARVSRPTYRDPLSSHLSGPPPCDVVVLSDFYSLPPFVTSVSLSLK